MKVFYLNKKTAEYVEIEPEPEVYCKLLDCSYITITTLKVNGKEFAVICDDEGLLTKKSVSALDENLNPVLVGSLIFAHDDEGELTDITREEADFLSENLALVKDVETGEVYLVMATQRHKTVEKLPFSFGCIKNIFFYKKY